MRKLVFLALALFLVGVGVSFAGGQGEKATAAGEETVTMVRWGQRAVPESNNTEVFQRVEKLLKEKLGYNVKFEIRGVDDETTITEKLNLMLASNDIPDVVTVWGNNDLMKQGLARFTVDDVKKWMPMSYKSLVEVMQKVGLDEATTWERYKRDGKLVQIPNVWYGGQFPHGQGWRKDLLDKYGLGVPSTVDEIEAAFKAYKAANPNKYPWGAPGKNLLWQCFSMIMDATGVQAWHWVKTDSGRLEPGRVQPELKAAFKILADWYKKGYIDPEWPTVDNTKEWQIFRNGDRLVHDWMGYNDFTGKPYLPGSNGDLLTKVVPDAEIVPGPYPVLNPPKKPSVYVWNPFHGGSYGFGRQLESNPDKLHKMMQIQMYLLQDKDIYLTHQYGIQGKNWDYDKDGIPTLYEQFRTNDAKKQIGIGYWWISCYDYTPVEQWGWVRPRSIEARKKTMEDPNGVFGKNKLEWHINAGGWWGAPPVVDQDGEPFSTKYGEIMDRFNTLFVEIITGSKPVSAFDDYIDYFWKNGGKQWVEAHNKVYGKYY